MFFKLELNQLPFTPVERQVIYVENEYNEKINRYIQKNYDAICTHFRTKGYEFCYLPILSKELSRKRLVSYYTPHTSEVNNLNYQNDFLLQFMANPQNRNKIPSSLVYYSEAFAEDGICILRGISLNEVVDLEKNDFSDVLNDIREDINNHTHTSTIRFRIASQFDDEIDDGDDDIVSGGGIRFRIEHPVPAEEYSKETLALLEEIEERIAEVKRRGVSAYVLEQLINKSDKLSRLVITSDYRILLPDYDNMEIFMTPLVKSVYLLFLRHPEGIIFKHLFDYRVELLDIYKRVKGWTANFSLNRSVDDATNPMKNSINEKCARIREAFVTRFDERLAQNYIITGKRGEPKRITLPQDMIIWE